MWKLLLYTAIVHLYALSFFTNFEMEHCVSTGRSKILGSSFALSLAMVEHKLRLSVGEFSWIFCVVYMLWGRENQVPRPQTYDGYSALHTQHSILSSVYLNGESWVWSVNPDCRVPSNHHKFGAWLLVWTVTSSGRGMSYLASWHWPVCLVLKISLMNTLIIWDDESHVNPKQPNHFDTKAN